MSKTAAIRSGDRRAALEALRDVLWASIVECEPAQRASLAKQLREVLNDLDALPTGEVSVSDDLRARRASRLAAASDQASAR
jgi:hypothetical protein